MNFNIENNLEKPNLLDGLPQPNNIDEHLLFEEMVDGEPKLEKKNSMNEIAKYLMENINELQQKQEAGELNEEQSKLLNEYQIVVDILDNLLLIFQESENPGDLIDNKNVKKISNIEEFKDYLNNNVIFILGQSVGYLKQGNISDSKRRLDDSIGIIKSIYKNGGIYGKEWGKFGGIHNETNNLLTKID